MIEESRVWECEYGETVSEEIGELFCKEKYGEVPVDKELIAGKAE